MPPLLSSVLAGRRMVIVEDEAIIQLQICRILKAAGLVVVGQANSAEAGIDLILREQPDLVTMDVNLGRMDGIEATRQIMAQLPTCIVVMTAYAQPVYQKAAQQAGASGYIIKPFLAITAIPGIEQAYQRWINGLVQPHRSRVRK